MASRRAHQAVLCTLIASFCVSSHGLQSEVDTVSPVTASGIRLPENGWESTNVTLVHQQFPFWHIPGSEISAKDLKRGSPEYLNLFMLETKWYNDIVLYFVPSSWRSVLPHWAESWLRNYVAGILIYFSVGGLWCFYVYKLRGDHFYPPGTMPSIDAIFRQIQVSMKSMPFYVSLPTISEAMVQAGWTQCYSQIEERGFWAYLGYFVVYMLIVEFGIYWMHRELHEIKPLYKWLHATHHVYNKQNTLSPFAGLAFHPLDGILQASPHVMALFLLPTHFFTHEIMLFMESIWTTNIHDNVDERIPALMGAGYHTIHHTTYRHNYGHYTILMDWMFGTLREPEGREKKES